MYIAEGLSKLGFMLLAFRLIDFLYPAVETTAEGIVYIAVLFTGVFSFTLMGGPIGVLAWGFYECHRGNHKKIIQWSKSFEYQFWPGKAALNYLHKSAVSWR